MDKNTTEYEKRLLEYRERMSKRNMELTFEEDDEDEIDLILERFEPSKKQTRTSSRQVQMNQGSSSTTNNSLQNQPVRRTTQESYRRQQERVEDRYESYDEDDDYDEYDDETVATRFNSMMENVKESIGKFFHRIRSGKPLSKNSKWIIALVIVLIIFICVTVVYLKQYAKYKYNQMDIHVIAEKDILVNDGVKTETKGYKTIVLYGVDSRESNLNQGTNSDCIIIVSINDDTKEVKLVSIYRDTLFKIQNDSKTTQKVNYAYQAGGALTSINTLNANLDLQITDYIAVDFNGMADIIDALGGVEVSIEENEINNLNKNLAEQISISGKYSDGIYETGIQTLKGQQAVAYSRIRSTELGDITRTERQREVLFSLVDKLFDADATTLDHLLDVSFNCISTSFTRKKVEELLKDFDDYKITSSTGFPFTYSALTIDEKGSVLVAADMNTNVEALHEYLYGNASYTPSETVAAISDEIKTETGVQAQTIDDVNDNTPDNNNPGQTTNGITTLTEPPEGMIVDE